MVLDSVDPDPNFDIDQFDLWDMSSAWTQTFNQPDNHIDAVYIIYRNINESWGGLADFRLKRTYTTSGGKIIDSRTPTISMTINTGAKGSYTYEDKIGLLAHEYGHYLFGGGHNFEPYGLSRGTRQFGIGLMPGGHGTLAMNPHEKYLLGYLNYQEVSNTSAVPLELPDFISSNIAYKLTISTNEYFVVANHQKTNIYDKVRYPGVYVYHVKSEAYGSNHMDIECADGLWDWTATGWVENTQGWGATDYCGLNNCRTNGPPDMLPILERTNINRTSGRDELQEDFRVAMPDETTTYWWHKYIDENENYIEDWFGDLDDAYNLNYNKIFSPWSNPASLDKSGNTINSGFELTNDSSGTFLIQFFIGEEDLRNAPPSKTQILPKLQSNLPIITWFENLETDVTGYQVERNYNNGGWQQVAVINSRTVTSFADLALLSGFNLSSPIKYRVRAVDSDNNFSLYSEEAALIIDNTNFKVIYGYIRDAQSNPVEGVTVNFNNGGGSAATDANGLYIHAIASSWSGDAVPVYSCYSFTPSSKHYNYAANQSTDYNGSMSTYKVSGTITFNSSNPLSGVAVKFYDTEENLVNTITTNSSGYYEATFPCGWSGEIVPVKTDVAFTSESISVSNLSANSANNNFNGRSQIKISGWVYYEGTSNTVDEAELYFSGGGFNATDFSDHGYYEMEIPPGWSGSIYISKTAHRFTPDNYSVTNVNTSAQINFSAQIIYETISGYVKDAAGNPVQDVNINFSNGGGTTVTKANGFYQRQLLQSWSGSVKPEKDNAEFYPDSISLTLSKSYTNQNFALGYVYQFNHETKITPFFSMYEDYWLGKE
ncbi:MAG: hypothetical protein F9K42_08655, partial [Ignavibacterium sp.]